jgi:Protein of unknown function (DUF4058)
MMKPVRSIKNQYRGINAHLHSFLQTEGGWPEFHTRHIVHLADALKSILLPMGYTTAIEPSVQIRRIDTFAEPEYPEADIAVYDFDTVRYSGPLSPLPMSSPGELVLPVEEMLRVETLSAKDYNAIKIYEVKSVKLDRGDPVAWIELLSPSNKPGGQDAKAYFNKRASLIEGGMVFVEIDYLHESSPALPRLPNYRARKNHPSESDAHPYRIVIVDPRPDIKSGVVRINEFDVDVPIPTLSIQLNGDDILTFDFGVPYQKTYVEALYGLEWVDYSHLPVHFERYSIADQTRIAAHMLAVLEAAHNGIDLESASFPVKEVDLETALAEIKDIIQASP